MQTELRSLVFPADEIHTRNTEASIVQLENGDLFLASSRFGSSSRDDAGAEIVARRSSDRGDTWKPDEVLQPNTGSMNVMSPSLLRLSDGDLAFFYLQKDSHSSCVGYFRRSSDEAASWSEPVRATPLDGYNVVVNDSLVQLGSGRLLVPTQHGEECWTDREHYVCFASYSDDGGTTWHASSNRVDLPKRGTMEPVIVERTDGSLLMAMRTQLGAMYYAESRDGGERWSPPWSSGIASPEAPQTLKRIPATGEIVLVWNHGYVPGADHCGPRRPLSLAVSRNEGETFQDEVELERSPERTHAYPSILPVGRRLYLTYYETDHQMGLGTDRVPRISLVFRRLHL